MAIILTIDDLNGTLHTEFESKTHISRATVSKRIKEAVNLQLLEASRSTDDYGNAKRYFLSQTGRVYRTALESMGLDETYQTYLRSQRELNTGLDEIEDWIEEVGAFYSKQGPNNRYSIKDELKSPETYPGDDVRLDVVNFITFQMAEDVFKNPDLDRWDVD